MKFGRLTLILSLALPGLAHATTLRKADQSVNLQHLFGEVERGQVSPNNAWEPPTGRPRGWVMTVHGGAWFYVGHGYSPLGPGYFNPRGWGVYGVDYRQGGLSFWDTLAAYDHLRAVVGYHIPVCLLGGSAGGQLALLVAGVRPSVSCVISKAGPVDFTTLGSQPVFTALGQPPSATEPASLVASAVIPAFGHDLWRWSPLRFADRLRMPVLLGGSSWDPIIPDGAQMAEMKAARPATVTMLLPGAPIQGYPWTDPDLFIHASVTPAAMARWNAKLGELLNCVERLQRCNS